MWFNSSVGNALFFVFWWHHIVVGSTLWHVIMLFLSDSSGNNHVNHNKAIYIRVYLHEYISMFLPLGGATNYIICYLNFIVQFEVILLS